MQASQILQDPKPVILLASSEPLLLRDWLDDARNILRGLGFEDILNLQSDAGFDWNELLQDFEREARTTSVEVVAPEEIKP